MASNKKSKQEGAEIEPCHLAEVPVSADYPFGSLLCRKEYEGIFKQLFPLSSETEKSKEDRSTGIL